MPGAIAEESGATAKDLNGVIRSKIEQRPTGCIYAVECMDAREQRPTGCRASFLLEIMLPTKV